MQGMTIASMYCLSVFSFLPIFAESFSKAQLVSRSFRQNVALRTSNRFTMQIHHVVSQVCCPILKCSDSFGNCD